MLTKESFEKRIASMDRPNLAQGIMPSTPHWFLNAGIMVRTPNSPGASQIGPEQVFGMTYIYSGSGEYSDDRGIRQPLRPGQVFTRLPNRVIKITANLDEKWVGVIFSFPQPYWAAMEKTVRNLPSQIAWDVRSPLELIEETLAIQALLEKGDELSRSEALGRMQTLTLRYIRNRENGSDDNFDTIEQLRLALSKTNSVDEPLPELAARYGIGYETFRKRFRSRFGESPAAYRNRMRIESACRLLSNTKAPISEISERLAYSDIFVFSRQFKITMKCSPTEYRLRNGKNG